MFGKDGLKQLVDCAKQALEVENLLAPPRRCNAKRQLRLKLRFGALAGDHIQITAQHRVWPLVQSAPNAKGSGHVRIGWWL
jgi:hypothetical protein